MDETRFFVWLAVKRHLKGSSIKCTRIRYDFIFRWLDGKPLTAEMVESFVLLLRERRLRNSSINSYIRVFNLIDIYEREEGRDLNLLKRISYYPKENHVPTILSIEEIESIIFVDIEYTHVSQFKLLPEEINRNYKLFTWTIASTGARFDEIASLTRENLHLGISDGYVVLRETKTYLDRQVPIPPTLVSALADHLRDKKARDFVFTTANGNKIVEQCYNKELRRRSDAAGIKNKHIHCHCFRNSYIMEHIRRGTDPLTIAKLVGHRDVNTTLGYTKFDYDDILRGAENHPFFSRAIPGQRIIDKILEAIEKWPIKHDPRFAYSVHESPGHLSIDISLSSGATIKP